MQASLKSVSQPLAALMAKSVRRERLAVSYSKSPSNMNDIELR